jgi:hypothetical protein
MRGRQRCPRHRAPSRLSNTLNVALAGAEAVPSQPRYRSYDASCCIPILADASDDTDDGTLAPGSAQHPPRRWHLVLRLRKMEDVQITRVAASPCGSHTVPHLFRSRDASLRTRHFRSRGSRRMRRVFRRAGKLRRGVSLTPLSAIVSLNLPAEARRQS